MRRLLAALLLVTFTSLSINAQLVPKDAVPEKVADGYKFTEGPALGPDGCIYFTDIPAELILKFDPESGETKTAYENSGKTNGLMFVGDKLYGCSHGERALLSFDTLSGKFQTVYDKLFELDDQGNKEYIRFNSPNDLAIDSDKGFYFTDPRYGNRDNMETQVEGVYYYHIAVPSEYSGSKKPPAIITFRKIDTELTRPNGIVLSPDESILYVADHGANWIYAYDIESPGKVKNKRQFARLNDGKGGGSDGMCGDQQGRLYATGHGKVWVFEPTGELAATIAVGKQTTNCTFGADGKTLYITANKGLYRITLNTDAPLEHAEAQDNCPPLAPA